MSCLTIARYLPKHPLIHLKYAIMIIKITRRSCKHFVVQISIKEMITWHDMYMTIYAATPLHCLAMMLLSNSQNLQKDMRDIHDARMVPMERG